MRKLFAAIAGFLLYFAAVVQVGGIAATWGAPSGFFSSLQGQQRSVGLALWLTLSWALPVFLVVAGGTLAALRLLATRSRSVSLLLVLGMLTGFAFWLAPESQGSGPVLEPRVQSLLALSSTPWWSLPNLCAPWLGLAVGLWLSRRLPSGGVGAIRA